MRELLFNPFRRIAGFTALWIGLAAMALGAVIAYYSHCHFDGVLDLHLGGLSTPMWSYFAEVLFDWLSVTLVFFVTALICAGTKVRFIDIAGTMALSRWPMTLAALLCLAPVSLSGQMNAVTVVVILGIMFFCIWMVALMYQAYTVSAHLSGSKAIWSFVIALIISEALSKLITGQMASVYTLNLR